MVSIFEIDLGAEQLDLQNWISAWSVLADTFAVLSQRIEVDNGEGRIVDQGIRAEGLVFSGPNLPNDQQRINYCLQHRQFNAISLTVFDAREAKDEVVHLAVTNPHALADANGIFAIAKELIQSVIFQDQVTITTPNRASSQEQLTAPSPAPREDLGLKDMFEVAKKGVSKSFNDLTLLSACSCTNVLIANPFTVHHRVRGSSERDCYRSKPWHGTVAHSVHFHPKTDRRLG